MEERDPLRHARWRKATGSGDGGCVEVGSFASVIGGRDTKDREGPVLAFSLPAWQTFIEGIKSGDLDGA